MEDGIDLRDEPDLTLGPFYDLDGTEILPCTTEQTNQAVERCMGDYRLCSNVSQLHGRRVAMTAAVMTRCIQDDWNRLMQEEPGSQSDSFLLGYRHTLRAVGKLAEDLVCAELFREELITGDPIERVLSVDDAIDAGLFTSPGRGIRCDDQVLVTQSGARYLAEVKASFTGRSYLLSALPKAVRKLRSSLPANPEVTGVLFLLISLPDKWIVALRSSREEVESRDADHWLAAALAAITAP